MADVLNGSSGAARSVETLLRNAGGGGATTGGVLLRMPADAVSGDDGEQLGMATPSFQDVPLAPCVFRKTGMRGELLVSAATVAQAVGSLAYDSAAVLFARAAGVVDGDELLPVEGMEPLEACGAVVAYRVRLGGAAIAV